MAGIFRGVCIDSECRTPISHLSSSGVIRAPVAKQLALPEAKRLRMRRKRAAKTLACRTRSFSHGLFLLNAQQSARRKGGEAPSKFLEYSGTRLQPLRGLLLHKGESNHTIAHVVLNVSTSKRPSHGGASKKPYNTARSAPNTLKHYQIDV